MKVPCVGVRGRFRTAQAQRQLSREHPCKPAPYRRMHNPFNTASRVQNSGPWDRWLPAVENSRLFTQCTALPLPVVHTCFDPQDQTVHMDWGVGDSLDTKGHPRPEAPNSHKATRGGGKALLVRSPSVNEGAPCLRFVARNRAGGRGCTEAGTLPSSSSSPPPV